MRIKNTITDTQVHLMTVNNDSEGKMTINRIRQGIKASKTKLRVILYGRGHRYGKGRIRERNHVVTNWDNSYQSHVPLNKAERIAIYIMGKRQRTTA